MLNAVIKFSLYGTGPLVVVACLVALRVRRLPRPPRMPIDVFPDLDRPPRGHDYDRVPRPGPGRGRDARHLPARIVHCSARAAYRTCARQSGFGLSVVYVEFAWGSGHPDRPADGTGAARHRRPAIVPEGVRPQMAPDQFHHGPVPDRRDAPAGRGRRAANWSPVPGHAVLRRARPEGRSARRTCSPGR